MRHPKSLGIPVALLVAFLCCASSYHETACPLGPPPAETDILIGWLTDIRTTTQFSPKAESRTTTVGPFRIVAVLSGSTLRETEASSIQAGDRFWPALAPQSKPVELYTAGSFLDHMDYDHCVYFGELRATNLPRWTLFTSRPLPGTFRAPTAADRAEFYRLNDSCVDQGDYEPGKQPPCTRPELLGVTDLDHDGQAEYWATQPYLWDTGLTVWKVSNGGAELRLILEVCVGCSD